MTIRMMLLGALCAVLAAPASAQPPEPGLNGDLQCLLAIAQMQGSSDPLTRTIGMMGAMFFAGKIFGAAPDIELQAALEKAARGARAEPVQVTLQRCGEEMERRGDQLQALGRNLDVTGL